MKIRLLTILLLLAHIIIIGQSPIFKEVPIPVDDEFKYLKIDSLGFLWAVSDQNIYKYDGINIENHFQTGKDSKITSFDEDRHGHFIIGISDGSLIKLNPFTYKIIPLEDFQNIPITFLSCEDFDHKCILVSYGVGLRLKFGKIDTFLTKQNILPSNDVYEALFLEGEIWLASDQGLQRIRVIGDRLENRIYNDQEFSDIVITNLASQNKDLWVSTFNKSIERLLFSSQIEQYFIDNLSKINDIVIADQLVYVCTTAGLYTIIEDSLQRIYPLNGEQFINTAVSDKLGNIWLSDKEHPLILGERLFRRWNPQITNIQAISFFDDQFLIGSDSGLFKKTVEGFDKILEANITAIEKYNEDYLWVGTFSKGIFLFNSKLQIIGNVQEWDGHSSQSIMSITPFDQGAVVASLTGIKGFEITVTNGKNSLKSNKKYEQIEKEGYVYQTLKDNERLYFATDRQGLKILVDNKLVQIDSSRYGEKIGSVFSMAFDQKKRLWLSTSEKGLGYVDGDSVFVSIGNRNINDEYTSIITLHDTSFLLIRAGSIDWFDPGTQNFLFFDNELEIANEAAYLNNFVVIGSTVFFVHDQYIYNFSYDLLKKKSPNILLENVLVNLEKANDRHVFKQEENNVQFYFIGSWLSDPTKLTYRYKLEGFDEEWRETGDMSVAYPKLEPGNYVFSVLAGVDGSYNSGGNVAKYSFEIKRYFYNTIWFRSFSILFMFSLILYLFTLRRKQQLQNAEIKQKHVESQLENLKSQLNPHFLFNSFNTLVGLIEEDQKDNSLSFVENLTDFYRLILEHGKQKLVSIDEEIRLVKLYVELLNERFQNGIFLYIPEKPCNSLMPPLTLQLLVENAIKHNEVGNIGRLEVMLSIKDDYISVRNNRKPKQYPIKSSGSGLSNIKKRYLLLNPKSVIISDTDNYFEVLLPIIDPEQ